jgi:UDP-glucose 4-epimerase
MKKAIVTGGAGFIGSHLVDKLLVNEYQVTVIDNLSTGRLLNLEQVKDKIKFIEADISEIGGWISEFKEADYIYHIAALADIVPSIQNPEGYFKSNVNGTFNVLQAAILSNQLKKLVYAASSSCYGIPDEYPTKETADIRPQYPYALTKRMGEELVLHWGQVYKLPVISTRFFNVYGPRSRTSGTYGAVFGVFLAQKLADQPYTVVGDGNQTRDFTFVSDVADAIYSASQSNITNEIFNIGSGKTISVNRIVELLDGKKVHIPKRPGEPDCTFANIAKIKSLIGWSPKVSIEDGILELIRNIDYWREAPVWTPDKIKDATLDWFKYLGSANK